MILRFLVDECADERITSALRAAGHDVMRVADVAAGAPDEEVAALARHERRILVTEDRDFGRLVYVMNEELCGVVYVRWRPRYRDRLGPAIAALVRHLADDLERAFVVLTPAGARVRRPRG